MSSVGSSYSPKQSISPSSLPSSSKKARTAKSSAPEQLDPNLKPLTQVSDQIARQILTASSSTDHGASIPPPERSNKRGAGQISNGSQAAASSSSSVESSQVNEQKTHKGAVPLSEALFAGFKLFYPVSEAKALSEEQAPKIYDLINMFRGDPIPSGRTSKKKHLIYPHTAYLKKLPQGEILVSIYGPKSSKLGKGGTLGAKKSFFIIINPDDWCFFKKKALQRTEKGAILRNVARTNVRHEKLINTVKSTKPGERVYLTPPKMVTRYIPEGRSEKDMRFEMFQKLYMGSISQVFAKKKMTGAKLIKTLADAARGLKQIHDTGQVHRDIKGPNILVSKKGIGHVHDFDLLVNIGTYPKYKYDPLGYIARDHATEWGFFTPNCDIFGLTLSAAAVLIPRFEVNILNVNIENGSVKSPPKSWNCFKEKLEVVLKDPLEFIILCLRSTTKLDKWNEFRVWYVGERTRGEIDAKLTELFPVEISVLKMVLREFYNSKKLLVLAQESKLPLPLNLESWNKFASQHDFTTAEQMIDEFEDLTQLAAEQERV